MYKFTFKPFSAMAYPFIFYASNMGLFPFYFWGFGVIEIMKYSRKYMEAPAAYSLTLGMVKWAENSKHSADLRRSAGADLSSFEGNSFDPKLASELYEAILNDPKWADVKVDVATMVRQYTAASRHTVTKEEVVKWLEGIHTHTVLKKMHRSIETVTAISAETAKLLELNQKVDVATHSAYSQASLKEALEADRQAGKGAELATKVDVLTYSPRRWVAHITALHKSRRGSGAEAAIKEAGRKSAETATQQVGTEALRIKVEGLEIPQLKQVTMHSPQEASVLLEVVERLRKIVSAIIPVRVPPKKQGHIAVPVHTTEHRGMERSKEELKSVGSNRVQRRERELTHLINEQMEIPGFREVLNAAKGAISGASAVTDTFIRGKVSRGEIGPTIEANDALRTIGVDSLVEDVFKGLQRQGADSSSLEAVSTKRTPGAEYVTEMFKQEEDTAHVGELGATPHRIRGVDDEVRELRPQHPQSAPVAVPVKSTPPQSAAVIVPVRVPRKVRVSVPPQKDARNERRLGVKLMPWRKPKTGIAFDKIWLNPEHTEVTATIELRQRAIADLIAETDRLLGEGSINVRWTFEAAIRDWLNARMIEYPLLLELESLWQVCLEGDSESILTMVSEGCALFTSRYITPIEDEKKTLAAEAHISFKAMLDFTLMIEQFIWSSRFHYAASLGAVAIDDLVRVVTDWGNEMPEEQQYLARWFRWWAAGERTRRLDDESLSGLEATTLIKDKMVEYFDSRWGKRIVEYGADGMYIYSTDHSYIDRIRGKKHGVAGNLVDKKTMKEEYGFTEDDLVYDVEKDKRR